MSFSAYVILVLSVFVPCFFTCGIFSFAINIVSVLVDFSSFFYIGRLM